jgi:hypothetical protein
MTEDTDSDSGMFDDVLDYVFQKTRKHFESKLIDQNNKAIAQIFTSTNYQELFTRIESENLNKHDYNLFLEYYFSGEMGLIPPGVPPKLLPTKENEYDSSGLRKYFRIKMLDSEGLKQAWIQLYSVPEKTDISETPETRDTLVRLLREAPRREQEEIWLSNLFYLLRKLGRLYYKNSTQNSNYYRIGPPWLLEMFRKGEQIVKAFQTSMVQQSTFLFAYERAVVLNYLGAHGRAVDTLEEIHELVKQQDHWASTKIIHPALEDPILFVSMFSNLTRSWCGKAVDIKSMKNTVDASIAMCDSSKKSDEFATNAGAVLHYYSLLALFNNGSLSLLNDVKHPWKRFAKIHPDFYPERTKEYMQLTESPTHPWSEQLREGYRNLISESDSSGQHKIALHTLVSASGSLDLSNNNPLSSYDSANPSFADQINNWNAYIDMIHINQLRTTKKRTHHFDHYGPLKSESGSWLWITPMNAPPAIEENKKPSIKQGEHPYFFNQYLSQSFRSYSKPKSTKMDRMNLMATILRKLAQTLEDYVPKTARSIVNHKILQRLQKPILTLEKDEKDKKAENEKQGDEGNSAINLHPQLHTHVALDRVLSLSGILSTVVSMLNLTTIQASYRNGITFILDEIREQLSLEFIHLLVIVQSPNFLENDYLAVGEVNKIRMRIRKDDGINQYRNLNAQIERLTYRIDIENEDEDKDEKVINRYKQHFNELRARQKEIELELAKYGVSRGEIDNTRGMRRGIQTARSNENHLLFADYLAFEYKQFDSLEKYVDRYITDERAESILTTLSNAPWWAHTLEDLDEHTLAQTIVTWIRYRAEKDPIAKIHPRSRGGK